MSDFGAPTPLAEIEQLVQQRAKDEALDLDDTSTEVTLRALVDQEIGRWNDQFRRGLRAFPLSDADLVGERAMRNLTGYGPLGPLLGREIWDVTVSLCVSRRSATGLLQGQPGTDIGPGT